MNTVEKTALEKVRRLMPVANLEITPSVRRREYIYPYKLELKVQAGKYQSYYLIASHTNLEEFIDRCMIVNKVLTEKPHLCRHPYLLKAATKGCLDNGGKVSVKNPPELTVKDILAEATKLQQPQTNPITNDQIKFEFLVDRATQKVNLTIDNHDTNTVANLIAKLLTV